MFGGSVTALSAIAQPTQEEMAKQIETLQQQVQMLLRNQAATQAAQSSAPQSVQSTAAPSSTAAAAQQDAKIAEKTTDSPAANPSSPGGLIFGNGSASVTLYGTIDGSFERLKSSQTLSSRDRVNSNNSNFGIRADVGLPNNMRGWAQIESAVAVDSGASSLATRNSGVGVTAVPGTVLLGQWDSPYKVSTIRFDPFGDRSIGAYSAIMGGGGQTTGGNGGGIKSSFDRRISSTVQYWSPTFAGFSGRAAYGTDKERAADASTDPSLWAVSAAYEMGPIYITAAHENHKDFGSLFGPFSGRDSASKIGASYKLPVINLTLSATYEQLKYQVADIEDRKINDVFVSAIYRLGPHTFGASVAQKGATRVNGVDIADSKANLIGLRYGYDFNKLMQFYVMGVRLKNGTGSSQDFSSNPLVGNVPLGGPIGGNITAKDLSGQNITGLGTGLVFKF